MKTQNLFEKDFILDIKIIFLNNRKLLFVIVAQTILQPYQNNLKSKLTPFETLILTYF